MKTISRSILLIAVVLTSGCATLTKSQLNEVNCFGQLTSSFSAYPGAIVSTFNRIHRQQQIYRANSLADPSAHFNALVLASDFKKTTDPYSEKIDLSLKIIDQYAQGLVLLTSTDHNKTLDTAALKFGTTLDGLLTTYNKIDAGAKLPTGIGSVFASVITLAGDAYIRSKQAEDVKQVVPAGDKIIEKMTNNLLEFLGPADDTKPAGLKYLIAQEKVTLSNSYQAYLGMNRDEIVIENGKEKYPGFIKHDRFASIADDRDCLQMLQDLDGLEVLRLQCIQAVTELRAAHAKLLQDIQEKITIKEYAVELQNYGSEVKSIYTTINALKK